MSDVPPSTAPRSSRSRSTTTKKGTGLSQKVGPLPLWGWVLGATVVVYYLYKKAAGSSGAVNCPAGYVYDPNSQQCVQTASAATSGSSTTTSQSPFPTIGGVFEPVQSQQTTTPSTPTQGLTITPPGGWTSAAILSQPVASGTANWAQNYEVGTVPAGATVTPTGPAISGPAFSWTSPTGVKGSSSLWYPVSYNGEQGYVLASNIGTNPPPAGYQSGPGGSTNV